MIYNYLKNLIFKFFFKLKKKRVNFVYDSDLQDLIKKLGMNEKIKSGQVKCLTCNESISFENLGAIVKVKGRIEFICQNPVCVSNFNN
jgi:hypothetical protein